jgi:GDPmannose 4,6-dehydratase
MSRLKALIIGVNGQDGFYLSELLRKKGITVIGLSRSDAEITGSVSDISLIENLIINHQPQYIFHLAANSTTRHVALFENHETISTGTLNILESVRLHCSQAKVFLSGSAMQFKNEGLPIDELTSFEASSPYSIARIQSVYAARYYRQKFGLNVYVGYFFNHDSPLRSEQHVNQKIIRAVQRIANGSNESLQLGNIDVKKEFSFAGDIAEAIWLLINQNEIHEAVIGSGKAYSILEWAEYCFKTVNLNYEDYIVAQNGFIAEYDKLVSNPKVIMDMGWEPKLCFHQLADLMMKNK